MSINGIYLTDHEVWARALSDEQLCAEWSRRFGYAPDEVERDWVSLLAERDEWKRLAKAAERELPSRRSLKAMNDSAERGPGIERFHSDTTHWVDPLDLLADDT